MRKGVRVTAFGVRNVGAVKVTAPVSQSRVAAAMAIRRPTRLLRPTVLWREARELLERRNAVLRNVRLGTVPSFLFGNLRSVGEHVLQDQTVLLGELLGYGVSALGLIDRYIDGILEGWRFGVAEMSFRFTQTHGLDREGALVIVDTSSVSFRRYEVARAVATRVWEQAWERKADLPPALRNYFFREMKRRVTLDALEERWLEARRRHEAPLRLVTTEPSFRSGRLAKAQ